MGGVHLTQNVLQIVASGRSDVACHNRRAAAIRPNQRPRACVARRSVRRGGPTADAHVRTDSRFLAQEGGWRIGFEPRVVISPSFGPLSRSDRNVYVSHPNDALS